MREELPIFYCSGCGVLKLEYMFKQGKVYHHVCNKCLNKGNKGSNNILKLHCDMNGMPFTKKEGYLQDTSVFMTAKDVSNYLNLAILEVAAPVLPPSSNLDSTTWNTIKIVVLDYLMKLDVSEFDEDAYYNFDLYQAYKNHSVKHIPTWFIDTYKEAFTFATKCIALASNNEIDTVKITRDTVTQVGKDSVRANKLDTYLLSLVSFEENKFYFREKISKELKGKVYKKHGKKCYFCKYAKGDTLDHIIPVAKGGTTTLNNLVPCCRHCNEVKGNMDTEVFEGIVAQVLNTGLLDKYLELEKQNKVYKKHIKEKKYNLKRTEKNTIEKKEQLAILKTLTNDSDKVVSSLNKTSDLIKDKIALDVSVWESCQ